MDYQKNIQRVKEQDQNDWNHVHSQLQRVNRKSISVSHPNDEEEKEAEHVSRKVMNGESATINGTGNGINRKGEGAVETTPEFETQLEASKGNGKGLPEDLHQEMGEKMGADFSGVKMHVDSQANSMSENINAKAFTHGQDVYFGRGQFDPVSHQGRSLIAHELVHTVQQSNSGVLRKINRQHIDEITPIDNKLVKRIAQSSDTPIDALARSLYDMCTAIMNNHIVALHDFNNFILAPSEKSTEEQLLEILLGIAKSFFMPFMNEAVSVLFKIWGLAKPDPATTTDEIDFDWKGVIVEGGKSSAESTFDKIKENISAGEGYSVAKFFHDLITSLNTERNEFASKVEFFGQYELAAYNSLPSQTDKDSFRKELSSMVLLLQSEMNSKYSVSNLMKQLALKWIARNRKVTKKGRPKKSGAHIEYVIEQEEGKQIKLEKVTVHGPYADQVEGILDNTTRDGIKQGLNSGIRLDELIVPVHVIFNKETPSSTAEESSQWNSASRWLIMGSVQNASAQDKRKTGPLADDLQLELNALLTGDAICNLPVITKFGEYNEAKEARQEKRHKRREKRLEKNKKSYGYDPDKLDE